MPTAMRLENKRVYIAGHTGLVGSALVRRLAGEGCDILTVTHRECDLTRQREVEAWMADMKPEYVFLAAAKVGGILANDTYPAQFLYDNLAIATNIIHAAHRVGVKKLLFLGSSCIYPKFAEQPMREETLLTGALEPTNEWYAIAKIAGLKLCQAYRRQYGCDFISAMPTNLYGPGDNFNEHTSHVVPALLRKIHDAKLSGAEEVEVWGTGTPRREFLYVDDLADALLFLMAHYSGESPVNVGTGEDITIRELAEAIARVVGYHGSLRFNAEKPDGTPRKLLDISRIKALGWAATMPLEDGLRATYEWVRTQGGSRGRPGDAASSLVGWSAAHR
ncbi:MAG: GDP-L-fucose synthase [Alphaproteobacteria bacterium]|nr:GDP-L-fucose synthase [Alphaproteobacteria bacterium]